MMRHSMKSEYALTDEEIQLFRNNGFVLLDHTLSPERVEKLRETIHRDIENEVEPVSRNDEGEVGRISNIIDRDEIFWETITSDKVLDPLESLLGSNIVVLKNRHNHATLRRASDVKEATDFHRDVRQWSRPIVTVLFYLVETTLENGCTRIVPGSQDFPAEKLQDEDGGWDQGHEFLKQEVPVPRPKGGLLIINSLAMHRVGMNHTDEARMSMTVGYHSVDELKKEDDPNRKLVRGEQIYNGHDY